MDYDTWPILKCVQRTWANFIARSRTRMNRFLHMCRHLFNPAKAFPSVLTRITSLKVKLTLASLTARPLAKDVLSPSKFQLATVSSPRSSSIVNSLIPCKQLVYSSPVVISRLLGSCSILQPCALPGLSLVASSIFGLISSTI